ncbi:DUF6455 family protein [Ostreiculturibacter nitratireducens]|uniref:DUF6455 family protein n=1 Tax=Ostreiculturibacter nitratireducens TaxID=3075226 RepID=UPI0031B59743
MIWIMVSEWRLSDARTVDLGEDATMFGAKAINRHAALMNRMGEELGLYLNEALADGTLPVETWRGAVVRCTGCSDPEDCQRWLADHAETGAEEAPGYCRNRGLMESLRAVAARREGAEK